MKIGKRDLILASLAADNNISYRPVQIQKLLFLFEKKLLKEDLFNFVPFDYGPFDPEIYKELESLSADGLVDIVGEPFQKYREYKLTIKGKEIAEKIFLGIPEREREYLSILSKWVRSLSFSQLVGSIYNEFPDMRKNSIFIERS